jgi:hypothetical protein
LQINVGENRRGNQKRTRSQDIGRRQTYTNIHIYHFILQQFLLSSNFFGMVVGSSLQDKCSGCISPLSPITSVFPCGDQNTCTYLVSPIVYFYYKGTESYVRVTNLSLNDRCSLLPSISDFRFSNQNVNDRILKLYINKIQKHEPHKKRLDLPRKFRKNNYYVKRKFLNKDIKTSIANKRWRKPKGQSKTNEEPRHIQQANANINEIPLS